MVEIDGYRVLTDPILSERASPLRWAGPRRFYQGPIDAEDLPKIDVVLISHDHYDHLDHRTIVAIADRVERFVVPLGVGAHLEGWGVPSERITECYWWEDVELGDLRLVATPARHFSGRGLFDRDRTLWASWAILGPQHRVYFSGDTGMFGGFSKIGARYGPFDAALMHIGAYDERWAAIHMNPEEAVEAHQQLRGGLFFPIHWGTYDLALHGWIEPAERTLAAAEKAGLRVAFPIPGGSVGKTYNGSVRPWWRTARRDQPKLAQSGSTGEHLVAEETK